MISVKTIGCAAGILLPVTLTVCASEESPSTRISVMSYNIENGGAQVNFNKTEEAIKKSGADVVGIQEAWGTARDWLRRWDGILRPAPAYHLTFPPSRSS